MVTLDKAVMFAAGIAYASVTAPAAFGAQPMSAPDFAPNPSVSWVAVQGGFKPPASGAGPVQDDPAHPTISNDDFRLTE